MTADFSPEPPVSLPPLWQGVVRAIAQKALTAAATALTGYGVIATGQQAQFVSLGLSVALWGASFCWTAYQERHAHAKLKLAIAAPSVAVRP